jgi:hypothetical protein
MASGSSDKTYKVFDISEAMKFSEKGIEILPKIIGEYTTHGGPVLSVDFNRAYLYV